LAQRRGFPLREGSGEWGVGRRVSGDCREVEKLLLCRGVLSTRGARVGGGGEGGREGEDRGVLGRGWARGVGMVRAVLGPTRKGATRR